MGHTLRFDLVSVKEKIILTFVKMVRKSLFSTIAIGVKTILIQERDRAQLQRQLGVHSQLAQCGESADDKLLRGNI